MDYGKKIGQQKVYGIAQMPTYFLLVATINAEWNEATVSTKCTWNRLHKAKLLHKRKAIAESNSFA